jgi:pimeloyl-ACP methyl ester carboxylesterase
MYLPKKFGLAITAIFVFVFSLMGAWTLIAFAYENIKFDALELETNGHFDFASMGEEAYPLGTAPSTCTGTYGIKSYSIYKGTYPQQRASLGGGTGWHAWTAFSDFNFESRQQGDGDYWIFFQIGYKDKSHCGTPLLVDTLYSTVYRSGGVWHTGMLPNCSDGIQNQDETGIDAGGICQYVGLTYSSLNADTFEKINSSFNKVVQTLGTNLEGVLTKIEVQSSNNSANFYSSKPVIRLYECNDDTYGSPVFNGSNCLLKYSATSNDKSLITQSTQSFFLDSPILLDPLKYYFFTLAGSNTFNALPTYYGSLEDTVEGQCYQYRLTNPISTTPCVTVSDLYFNFYGVVKSEPAPARTPVVIVPGMMGSYLNREDGTEVWMNLLKMALPGSDFYLDELILSKEGLNINNPALVPADIFRKILSKDYFDGTIKQLESIGYKEGVDLFVFPYDWRFDISTIADKLEEKINEIKNQTGAQKIDVVAHSMGGLVVKKYLKTSSTPSVDKFIDIGTPHAGSPNAFKVLNYGDDLNISALGILGLNSERVKIISQNMPSTYQLLPSQQYFDLYSHYVSDLDDIDGNEVKGKLNYDQTKEFMKNMDRNSLLVDKASQLHQNIDDLNPSDYGAETYNIVGCGTQTLGKIFLLNKETSGGVEYNISYINGDGTVPIKSAEALQANSTYYLKDATHAVMASDSSVKELIGSIISEDENLDISAYPNILDSASNCNIPNGKIVSFHSPIELHIYDSHGNHTGPDINGDIENNIAGVSYDVIEGNKFAFLPEGATYKIMGEATDSGTFNARIQTITNEDTIETIYYNKVEITNTTQAQFSIDGVSTTDITLDKDGDGIFEVALTPTSVLDGNESEDITKPITNINITGNKLSDDSFISAVRVHLSAEDDNSGVLSTEYSLDGGTSWNIYDKPFTINERGGVELMYRSTDRAGNVETKSTIINIINPGNSGRKNI